MELNCNMAEASLVWAGQQNPGKWVEHSRFVALACKNIAAQCDDMSTERAYCFGLLHDIGRYAGISSERHLIDGYRFCMERGWEKAAQICISHAFMIQDIHSSIGTFDVTEEDFHFMESFIKNAHLIVLFGVSLGNSDLRWWTLIGQELKRRNNLAIIQHIYRPNAVLPTRKQLLARIERQHQKELLQKKIFSI